MGEKIKESEKSMFFGEEYVKEMARLKANEDFYNERYKDIEDKIYRTEYVKERARIKASKQEEENE